MAGTITRTPDDIIPLPDLDEMLQLDIKTVTRFFNKGLITVSPS